MGFKIQSDDDLNKAFENVAERVDGVKAALASYDERLALHEGNMADALKIAQETAEALKAFASRPGMVGHDTIDILGVDAEKAITMDMLHKMPTALRRKSGGTRFEYEAADPTDLIGRMQDAWDEFYLTAASMKLVDAGGRVMWTNGARELKSYAKYLKLRELVAQKAGMAAGTSGQGGTWDPTDFSNRLFEKARLPLKVAAVIPQFTMPRSPFLFPTQLADLTAYKSSENSTITSGLPGGTAIADGVGSTTVTGSKTFTSVKIATAAYTSKELEEDSIIAILPFLQGAVLQAAANGLENAILNGDTNAVAHMDTDVTASTDVRKCFDGLRDYALNVASSGTVDAAGNYINSDDRWRDYIRAARKKMDDPYKGNAEAIALVVNGNTAVDVGSVEAFRTMYAIGSVATNQNADSTGFRPDGYGNFIVSEFQRGDLGAAGVYSAASAYSTAIQFFKNAWLLGVERSMRVEVSREVGFMYDQDVVKVTWRGDLKSMLAGNHTVLTYGIKND